MLVLIKKRTFAAIWSHKAMSGVLSIIKGSDLLSLYLVGHASSYWPIATGVHIYLDLSLKGTYIKAPINI